ncbi:hypothetical protein [Haloferula sp.]
MDRLIEYSLAIPTRSPTFETYENDPAEVPEHELVTLVGFPMKT